MALENSKRDQNYVTTLLGVDMSTGILPTKVYVDESTHRLLVNAVISGGGASDGAIVDGSSSSIKATVFDLTNSNPLATQIVDANGDAITSFGGGTQYTEGDTDASITGTAILWEDAANTLTTVNSSKPLPVTVITGFATSVKQDSQQTTLDAIKTDVDKIPSQGQALAAASTPVVLPAAQITTLTPPAAITGYATSAKQDTAQTSFDAIKTSVELIDDAIKADDAAFTPATTKVMMSGFEFDDSSPDSVDEGDAGAARMSGNRNQYVQIRDNAGNERGLNIDANGEIQISGSRNALTVGSHAVTNAGTFVVQENGAALTSLQLIDDTVYTDDTSTHSTGSSKGLGIMAAATPTDTSVNANDIGMVAMTTDRRLLVDASGVAVPITDNSGSLTVDNGGTFAVQASSLTPGTAATNLGKAEDAAHTTGDTGVMSLGVRSAVPSDRSAGPTDGDYEPFALNEVGAVWNSLTPSANGGLSTYHLVSAGSTNATNIKASTGNVYGWYIYNSNAAARKLAFHNTAGSPTAGASVFFAVVIPPGAAANVEFTNGIQFSTGIAITTVTELTDAGATGVAASDLIINIFYK